jgi:NADH-quinone oxidoreductase subunit J
MVINSKNPVYSVIFLILVFINSGGLLIYFGAEFIGMAFLVVYIGAVAILFLFVVMMINVRYVELSSSELYYLPLNGFFLILPFCLEFGFYLHNYLLDQSYLIFGCETSYGFIENLFFSSNLQILGFLLYSSSFYLVVIISSLILLVAMVGSIALTLVHRFDVRRQDVFVQLTRSFNASLSSFI